MIEVTDTQLYCIIIACLAFIARHYLAQAAKDIARLQAEVDREKDQ